VQPSSPSWSFSAWQLLIDIIQLTAAGTAVAVFIITAAAPAASSASYAGLFIVMLEA
jgi:hypothetical protein